MFFFLCLSLTGLVDEEEERYPTHPPTMLHPHLPEKQFDQLQPQQLYSPDFKSPLVSQYEYAPNHNFSSSLPGSSLQLDESTPIDFQLGTPRTETDENTPLWSDTNSLFQYLDSDDILHYSPSLSRLNPPNLEEKSLLSHNEEKEK